MTSATGRSAPAETGSASPDAPQASSEFEALVDMRQRLDRAYDELLKKRQSAAAMHSMSEYNRLDGKAEGIALALSYVHEALRALSGGSDLRAGDKEGPR